MFSSFFYVSVCHYVFFYDLILILAPNASLYHQDTMQITVFMWSRSSFDCAIINNRNLNIELYILGISWNSLYIYIKQTYFCIEKQEIQGLQ